ncbi:MAG: alpha-galactosidase [Armatimonadetes bacterium]|nr:alpha-galactosidase [Armatimonadota bacterium]
MSDQTIPEISLNRQWAERMFSAEPESALPFSFQYGGQELREFIGSWKREISEEAPDDTCRFRTLTLIDPETGLEARAVVTIYTDTPGVDWTLYLTNRGSARTPIIETVNALDASVSAAPDAAPVLHRLHGSAFSAHGWLPFHEPMAKGQRVEIAPAGGKSSQGASPFFSLSWGDGGIITAVGWPGQWNASAEWDAQGILRLRAGMASARLMLHPGESIRSLRILKIHWTGTDHERACNLFRQTMLGHITPKVSGTVVTPPIVHLSTSFYELNDSTEENVLSHLEAIKNLGFEYFWLDAYWTRGGFPDGMGNYGFPLRRVEPPDRFPGGLKPVGDALHREGMKFVVWSEPERVAAGTHIASERPEWVISPDGSGNGLLNLGLPDACDYLTRYLIAAIREYGIDCLRIDFNINPLPFWEYLDRQDAERAGMAEIRYVEGHYRMWDAVLRACPHLFIDNCASGGERINLETCSRSIPLWRTDTTIDPLNRRDFNQAAL